MHMRWTDHACNMIDNYVCFMLVDMRVYVCVMSAPMSATDVCVCVCVCV